MHLKEFTKSSNLTYEAKIFHVTKDIVELEDGKLVQRDVVHHSGGVCVVPLTERHTILMVQQYRYPFHEVTLEIPAGKREKEKIHCNAVCGNCEKRLDAPAKSMQNSATSIRHRLMIQKSSICISHRNSPSPCSRNWTPVNFWMSLNCHWKM